MYGRTSIPGLILLSALALAPAASPANGMDFAEEAEKAMRLSVDLDDLQGKLAQPLATPQQAALPPLPLEPNSKMASVTVFNDRALAERFLSVHAEKGTSSVTFEGLPLGIATDTLHALVRSGSGRIVGVELISGQGKVEETERIQKIREEMKVIAEQLGQVQDRIESLLAQRSYLRTTLLSVPENGRPQPGLDQVKGALDYVGATERLIAAELRKEQDKAKELDEKLRPLLIKSENPLATGMTVRVDLETDRTGDVEVGLRYQVGGARWWPAYNARLDEATGRVIVEYFGIVSQQTGEAWDGVDLALSTANPAGSGAPPELEPWYLGRNSYGYSNILSEIDAGRGYQEPMDVNQQTAQAPGGMVESQMTASVQGAGAVVFAIPGKRIVAGDGSEQRLPVGSQTFTATMELATVPRVAPEVYRQARVRYEGTVPLLPGTVSSFVGPDYVGSGTVRTVVPGEEMLLSFGTDDRLKVERNLLSRQQEKVGKKTTRYTFHYRIKVSNFGDTPQQVRLLDQIPVSEIDRVEVRTLETTPSLPAEPDDGPGIVRWKLDIPAGGNSTVDIRFSVTTPDDVYIADMVF